MNNIDAILPQMLPQIPPIIAVAKSMQGTLLTLHSSFSGSGHANGPDDRYG